MRLEFESLSNARDLGGLVGHMGRKIKMGRLIRSDNLSRLTNKDCLALKEYGLSKVVDFRTEDEIAVAQDKEIEGVEIIINPILKSLTAGITRKEKKTLPLEEILLNFSLDLGKGGVEWLRSLYEPLVSDEFSLNGYRSFLRVLMSNKKGAVLFHCSAGKDRVGMGTAIILSALGVDRKDIINDYLLTNESYRDVIKRTEELGRERGVSEEIISTIQPLSGVDLSYIETALSVIDTKFGGMDSFLKNQMHLDEKAISHLRDNYLE